jgi:putative transposase
MKIRKAAHCSYRIRYHLVFVVKYRKSLIDDKLFEYLKNICKGIQERYFIWFEAIGHENNHVHIVVEVAPKYSPSRIIQICKSILAKQIFKRFPEIKDELWGGEFWTDGGHVDTIGDGRALVAVKNYVLNQGREEKDLVSYEF